jgi:polyhydroxyalkanoate synthase subunit PhaE
MPAVPDPPEPDTTASGDKSSEGGPTRAGPSPDSPAAWADLGELAALPYRIWGWPRPRPSSADAAPGAGGAAELSERLVALWRLWLEQLQRSSEPALDALRRAPGHAAAAVGGDSIQLARYANLVWDAYAPMMEGLLRSPGIGPTREFNEKLLHAVDAWLKGVRASADWQAVAATTWMRSYQAFLTELAERSERGQAPATLRQVADLYMQVAERVFADAFATEEYTHAQARAANSALAYRVREQAVADVLLKASLMPSRSEVDDAHRQIYELRKEVKALRRALHELQARQATRQRKGRTADDDVSVARPRQQPVRPGPARRQAAQGLRGADEAARRGRDRGRRRQAGGPP